MRAVCYYSCWILGCEKGLRENENNTRGASLFYAIRIYPAHYSKVILACARIQYIFVHVYRKVLLELEIRRSLSWCTRDGI